MAVLKPRERLVYFRISEDEFHQFVRVCEQEGARSVSDLARSAVQRLISDSNREQEERELTPKVERLEKLIAELNWRLQMLGTLLKGQDATVTGVGAEGINGGAALAAPVTPQTQRQE